MNKMKSGETLLLKVTSIQENVKTRIPFKTGPKNRHDIYMLDPKTGTEYVGEYLTPGAYDHMFTIGVMQYIKCICDNEKSCEVSLGTPPEENELEYLPRPKEMDRQNPVISRTDSQPYRPLNLSGSPISFGYAYAKDIVIEQIKKMDPADITSLGTNTLAKMVSDLGDAINDRMTKKATSL